MLKIRKLEFILRGKLYSNRSLLGNLLGTVSIKGLSMILQLLAIPVYMKYFENTAVLGVWLTIISVLNWVTSFDFGIGQGLRNKLTEAFAKKNLKEGREYVSSAYISIGVIVALLLLLTITVISRVNLNVLLNIDETVISNNGLKIGVFLILCGVILQLAGNLIVYILYAMQHTAVGNSLNLLANAMIIVFAKFSGGICVESKFIILCFAYGLFFNVPFIIATFFLFFIKLKEYIPRWKFFTRSSARSVIGIGSIIFLLQIIWLIINKTNEYLILRFVSPNAVVEYQVYNKVFSVISSFTIILNAPIWSAVTKAQTENNYIWINKMYKLLLCIFAIACLGEFVLVFAIQDIVNFWLKDVSFTVNYKYALIIAVSNSILILHSANTTISNGMSNFNLQLFLLTIGAALDIPLALFLIHTTGSWTGVIVANILCLVPYEILQIFDNDKKIKERWVFRRRRT